MSKTLDTAIEAAAKRQAHAMSPPSPSEVAGAIADGKTAIREIQEKTAET